MLSALNKPATVVIEPFLGTLHIRKQSILQLLMQAKKKDTCLLELQWIGH